MKHEFHNPDNLTPEQVGEGYRLLLKSEFGRQEEQHQEIETWLQPRKDWHKSKIGYLGNFKFCTYRVPLSTWPLPQKEWTLGNSVNGFTLAEGQQWHRTDWTKDMLPEGWRPLLLGETNQPGDMGKRCDSEHFAELCDTVSAEKNHTFLRTRRPLPAPEIPWIAWHGGKCPLKDDEVEEWEYQMLNGYGNSESFSPSRLRWALTGLGGDIAAYRVLKWKEKPQITGQTGPADMPNKCGPSAADFEPAPLDNDRWESLLHKNSTLEKRVKELEVELTSVRPYADAYQRVAGRLGVKANLINELQSKITAAQERLAQLEWRPVSVMPTKEDADPFGNVQVCGITDGILQSHGLHSINYPFKDKNTHWRPAALPTIPDPSREEFEKWWAEHSGDFGADKVEAQKIWKAARRTE